MRNRSLTAVNLTRDCQFNYIEFIEQISDIYFASFQLCAVIALNHFRAEPVCYHNISEVLTC